MENQKKKLRLEDIQVESFVTTAGIKSIGGNPISWNFACDHRSDSDCSGGDDIGSDRCGTNVANCTQGRPVGCYSNTYCPDATCYDGSWCCPPDSQNQTCGAFTCDTGCPGCNLP